MYIKIDLREMETLGLEGREMLVYSALRVLTHKQPWGGSYSELARISRCGSDDTADRIVHKLEEMGLVIKCIGGWSIPQNAANAPQNAASTPQKAANIPQNAAISEKESTQRKSIYINKRESERNNNNIESPTLTRSLKIENNLDIPTWQEFVDYALSRDIPQTTALKAFAYYEMRGWKDVHNWRAAINYWDLQNKK